MNEFYNHSGYPTTNSAGSSANMRAELDSVAAGFDKLPALSGNALKVVRVNASGTALEASNAVSIPVTSYLVKGDGAGGVVAASPGTDYAVATSGSTLLKGDGAGGFSSAGAVPNGVAKGNGSVFSAATSGAGGDYVAPGAAISSGLTISTSRILGRTTAGSGAVEEISVGTGLSLSSGVLSAAAASGSVIQPITASVAGNALTVTINPTTLDFRSSTIGSGTVNTRTISVAVSCTVPSSATLGTINATAARLAILAIDNAGTVETAIVNLAGGNDLSETGLISTTALSAAATANNVIYSTTARTNVPYRVVGFIDITEATAGTWATAPSVIQGAGGNAITSFQSLGYGQTYKNVTRNAGTTYYNTTGKPIFFSVSGYWAGPSSSGTIALIVNGSTVQSQTGTCASSNNPGGLYGVIPPGASYSWTNTGFTASSVSEVN